MGALIYEMVILSWIVPSYSCFTKSQPKYDNNKNMMKSEKSTSVVSRD